MITHNIGFYEDLTKIIFELSSNIIKYAPYFFYWSLNSSNKRDHSISRQQKTKVLINLLRCAADVCLF